MRRALLAFYLRSNFSIMCGLPVTSGRPGNATLVQQRLRSIRFFKLPMERGSVLIHEAKTRSNTPKLCRLSISSSRPDDPSVQERSRTFIMFLKFPMEAGNAVTSEQFGCNFFKKLFLGIILVLVALNLHN